MGKKSGAQAKLKKNVLEQSLCTGCGACVGLCPYQVIYRDRTVQLFECDLQEGKCHAFCPRTPVDEPQRRQKFFDAEDLTPEIGAVKSFYFMRAADPDLRKCVQHGGTVTALLDMAMNEGIINAALVSGRNESLEQEGKLIESPEALRQYSKSKFTVSPTVAAFHRLSANYSKKVGIVATPCQAQALAKIKDAKIDGYDRAGLLGLVIGLFCGWTLSLEKFKNLLQHYHLSMSDLTGMDIPAGKNILELQARQKVTSVPIAEVEAPTRVPISTISPWPAYSTQIQRVTHACSHRVVWS